MRQVLPSLLKTLHRGQKSSICESGKGAGGGRPSEASCLPRSVFSKSSFPKPTPHISMIFVHDEPILKKKAFSSPRLKKFRRGSGGRALAMALDTPRTGTRPSSDSPRCTVNRDATPPGGSFGSRVASWWSNERVVRSCFCSYSRMGKSWPGLLLARASQSVSQRAKTRVFGDSNAAQLSQLTTIWVGSCAPSRFAACPLAMPTFAPPSRAFHALLTAAESCASPRLRVG